MYKRYDNNIFSRQFSFKNEIVLKISQRLELFLYNTVLVGGRETDRFVVMVIIDSYKEFTEITLKIAMTEK